MHTPRGSGWLILPSFPLFVTHVYGSLPFVLGSVPHTTTTPAHVGYRSHGYALPRVAVVLITSAIPFTRFPDSLPAVTDFVCVYDSFLFYTRGRYRYRSRFYVVTPFIAFTLYRCPTFPVCPSLLFPYGDCSLDFTLRSFVAVPSASTFIPVAIYHSLLRYLRVDPHCYDIHSRYSTVPSHLRCALPAHDCRCYIVVFTTLPTHYTTALLGWIIVYTLYTFSPLPQRCSVARWRMPAFLEMSDFVRCCYSC